MLTLNSLQITGYLEADPLLSQEGENESVSFNLVHVPRYKDRSTGSWKDGDKIILRAEYSGPTANTFARTIRQGDGIYVAGALDSYIDTQGGKRIESYWINVSQWGLVWQKGFPKYSPSLNLQQIVGYLAYDPVSRHTPQGSAVTSIRIVHLKDEESTDTEPLLSMILDSEIWGQSGVNFAAKMKKRDCVYLIGELKANPHVKTDGTRVEGLRLKVSDYQTISRPAGRRS